MEVVRRVVRGPDEGSHTVNKYLVTNNFQKIFPKGHTCIKMSLWGPIEVTAELNCLGNQEVTYHARVYCARLVASTYHPGGDGLHVKVGLTLLQRNNADFSLLQLKRHWIFKKE